MNRLNQLHWPLIMGMGALALIRPFMDITGMTEWLGRPFGPIFTTVIISVAWLALVVFARVREPLLTLTFTGLAYGVFGIILSAILSPILIGGLTGPITNPYAVVSVLITNAIWGGILGVIAWGIQRRYQPENG